MAAAIEHDRRSAPDPRWRAPRPADPAPPTPTRSTNDRPNRLQLTLPAASGGALALAAGDLLTIEQLADGQGVDLRAFDADGLSFSAAQTRWMHGINPTCGSSLWRSRPLAPLLTIVRDTAPGHDLCFPPCSGVEYARYTGIDGHVGCTELHAAALAAAGGDPWPGDEVLNLWLPSAVQPDGRLVSWPAACRAGDAVALRADEAALVTLTTCPDDLYGTSQYEPKPVRVTVERSTSSGGSASVRLAEPNRRPRRCRVIGRRCRCQPAIWSTSTAGPAAAGSATTVHRSRARSSCGSTSRSIRTPDPDARAGAARPPAGRRAGAPGHHAAAWAPASSRASSQTSPTRQLIS